MRLGSHLTCGPALIFHCCGLPHSNHEVLILHTTHPRPRFSLSATMSTHETPTKNVAPGNFGRVTIHFVSPSFTAPARYTIRNIPLDTTVGELRLRLSEFIPGHPAPGTQRLFFVGRPLRNDDVTVAAVIGPLEVSTQVNWPFYLLEWQLTRTALGHRVHIPCCIANPRSSVQCIVRCFNCFNSRAAGFRRGRAGQRAPVQRARRQWRCPARELH